MIKLPARYSTVVKTLSGGGMSDTLVCRDQNLGRDVVIKTLKPGIEKHRLMDELSALADIRSKYVVQVLDVIRDGEEIVGFVEEHIDGTDLQPFAGGATAEAAMRMLYSIIAGISDIHDFGRVHRDIKPENMKLDSSGVLKIFDFGLAKLSTGAKTKQLYYTPNYTAPEVFNTDANGNYHFTQAVDVFAFGVTALWLMNSGKLVPELGHMPPSVPKLPVMFNTLPIQFSTNVNALLNLCLSADPTSRPKSSDIKAAIGKQLLFDKHRMLLTYKGTEYFIHSGNRQVNLSSGGDKVSIAYNGLEFAVVSVSGFARHNNKQLTVGYVLNGSSVIVLGDPDKPKTSITADVSHPEVMN